MIITCPQCHSQYQIDPSGSSKPVARVKCPGCQNLFEISLANDRPAGDNNDVAAGQRPVVLVVEDARFFREMIRDILGELPITMEEAADGQQAWEIITAVRPQLVLLDLHIPLISGEELLRKIRSTSATRQIKVLAMSGVLRGEETAGRVRQQGADEFLNKSFKPRELQNRVRSLLGL